MVEPQGHIVSNSSSVDSKSIIVVSATGLGGSSVAFYQKKMEEKRISWKTVNGICSGVIAGEGELGFLVRLDNGKYVIVDSKSIIPSE